jgi:WD40 repeat protein
MGRMAYILTLVIFLTGLVTIKSSDTQPEVITAENADRLVELFRVESSEGGIPSTAISPNSTTLAVLKPLERDVAFYSLHGFEVMGTQPVNDILATEIHYSADGSWLILLTRKAPELINVWDIARSEPIVHQRPVEGEWLRLSENTDRYAISHNFDSNEVSVHDLATNDELLRVPTDGLFYTLDDRGSHLLTTDENANVLVWDVDAGILVARIIPPSDLVPSDSGFLMSFGFTPEKRVWVSWLIYEQQGGETIGKGPVQIWDVTQNNLVDEIDFHLAIVGLIFDPIGRFLIGYGRDPFVLDTHYSLWDNQRREFILESTGISEGSPIVFAPSGAIFASEYSSQWVDVYTATGELLKRLPTNDTYFLRFSPDGRYLISDGYDVRVWGVPAH